MAEHDEEQYSSSYEMSDEEMEKIAGGVNSPFMPDIPANAPRVSNCPQCGTQTKARRIAWGAYTIAGPVNDNRCVGTFVCMNCGHEWTITSITEIYGDGEII